MQVRHAFGGKVYAKVATFEAGEILVQHKHNFDHLSILAAGTVELLVDGVRSVLTGPVELTIEAGKHHGVKALTAGLWYCLHSTDCTDPDDIDHEVIAPDSKQGDMLAMVEALR
jgi:quercetin dioxygenase-like cupin family protein